MNKTKTPIAAILVFWSGIASAQQFYLNMRVALVDDMGNVNTETVFYEPLLEESLYLSALHTFPDMSTSLNESLSEASLITGVLHARSICPGTSCSAKASWKDVLTFDATGIPAGPISLTLTATVEGITGPTVGTTYTLFSQSVANFAVVDTARATGHYFNSEPTTTANPDAFAAGEQQGTWSVYGPDVFVGQLTLAAGEVNDVHVETIINGDTTMDIVTTFNIVSDPPLPFSSASGAFLSESADADEDGIVDVVDNCSQVANPNQRDTDGDGFGNRCDPDLNNDGFVNFTDLQLLSAAFFGTDENADFNGDGNVNFLDLQIMQQYFFGPPGP